MKSDIEIAQAATLLPIAELAERFGIDTKYLEPYGKYKAKLSEEIFTEHVNASANKGRLVLVTAINPTPAGEGKTTTTVGLAQALNRLGKKTFAALREPSLGPCMGVKGGAAGGGYAQVLPMEDINLHFTGDIHAVTAAHNLLSAMLDNHLNSGNALGIDTRRVVWKRAMDMNDRALRSIVIGLGGKANGMVREDGFIISVASEVMAILCLSSDIQDLKARLSRIICAYTMDGKPVTAGDLKAQGAMAALLKDAIKPNLVQTLEGTPAIIHGGPFANIAHGCNSVRATKLALSLADIVVTEAGFGADLGAEKFLDIKCRMAGIWPDAVVLVATVRALKYNGGVDKKNLATENVEKLKAGLDNLSLHIDNLKKYGVKVVVALNTFHTDTAAEIECVREHVASMGASFAVSEVFAKGGAGGEALAQKVLEAIEATDKSEPHFMYELDIPVKKKIERIAKEIYGAASVEFSAKAKADLKQIGSLGLDHLPVCIAKTQYSPSDNPTLLGRPSGFTVSVAEIRISAGAGFVVAITGDIMTMPGLPKAPAAENIDIDENGNITGLF